MCICGVQKTTGCRICHFRVFTKVTLLQPLCTLWLSLSNWSYSQHSNQLIVCTRMLMTTTSNISCYCPVRPGLWGLPAKHLLADFCYINPQNLTPIRVTAPLWLVLLAPLWVGFEPANYASKDSNDHNLKPQCLEHHVRPVLWGLPAKHLLAGFSYINPPKPHSHLGPGTNGPTRTIVNKHAMLTS